LRKVRVRSERERIPKSIRITPKKKLARTSLAYLDTVDRLDPRRFYEARAKELAAASKPGIERFAYNIFGPSFLSSLAFALNPLAKFQAALAQVTPTNRTRKFTSIFPSPRKQHEYRVSVGCSNSVNCLAPEFQKPDPTCVTTTTDVGTWAYQTQPGYLGFVSDTTFRTRPAHSDFGEFELFAPSIQSPPRKFQFWSDIQSYAQVCGRLQISNTKATRYMDSIGPSAWVSSAHIDAVLAAERSNASAMFLKHKHGLIARALPTRPKFQSFYNVAELKDLPMLYRNTVQFFKDPLSVTTPRGAGNQYLNYKFGWEQALRSVVDLLKLPTLISNRVNYLIKRQGRASTFRSSMRIVDQMSSIPAFNYNISTGETEISNGTKTVRTIDLKCAVNGVLILPSISVPKLRTDLLWQLWGANPSPSDVYNLVPWTWLIDWFTGLGEYIDVLDRLNSDPTLINYGFITYKCVGEATNSFVTRGSDSLQIFYPPQPTYSVTTFRHFRVGSKFRYRYQLRKDLGSLSGVKSASKPQNLEVGQLAILGALLSKFAR